MPIQCSGAFMIHWRISRILKTSKILYEVMLFDTCKSMYILKMYSIHYTLSKKTQILRKFPSDKINGTKYAFFLLSWAPSHHSFTFNLRFLYELKHKVHLSKTVSFIFLFWFLFVKFNFLFNKIHGLFDFKTSCFLSKLKWYKSQEQFCSQTSDF